MRFYIAMSGGRVRVNQFGFFVFLDWLIGGRTAVAEVAICSYTRLTSSGKQALVVPS